MGKGGLEPPCLSAHDTITCAERFGGTSGSYFHPLLTPRSVPVRSPALCAALRIAFLPGPPVGVTTQAVLLSKNRGLHLTIMLPYMRWFVQVPLIWKSCVICGEQLPKYRSEYCSDKCSAEGGRKLQANCAWRKLHKRMGEKSPPSIDYVRAPCRK